MAKPTLSSYIRENLEDIGRKKELLKQLAEDTGLTEDVIEEERLNRQAASLRIEEVEKKRKLLRKIYEEKNPRGLAFNLIIDNFTFGIEQISDQIIFAIEQKNLLEATR